MSFLHILNEKYQVRQTQQPQFFYVSRDSVTAAFNWSSHKFKLRLHQPQETSEHKQALEKWLLKDVTTLNRSALQNGNSDCSRYQHTQADCLSCNHSHSSSEATGRAQQRPQEPSQDPGLAPQSQPTAKAQENKSLFGHSLCLPIAVYSCCSHREQHQVFQKPSVCSFAFCIISFPYGTFTKFGLNCSITWGGLKFWNNPEHWL